MLLLADAYASYRKYSYDSFGLDSLYCVSVPGFSNRAMLKMTNIEIKLIADSNADLIIKKGIRGGRFETINYHAKGNNKYVNLNFDKNKDEESYIVSLVHYILQQCVINYHLENQNLIIIFQSIILNIF